MNETNKHKFFVSSTNSPQEIPQIFPAVQLSLPQLQTNNTGGFLERPWAVFQGSDPLAQIRFDQSLDDQLGINSQRNPLGTGGTQSLESNGWQLEDVILDIPNDVIGQLDYRFLRLSNP